MGKHLRLNQMSGCRTHGLPPKEASDKQNWTSRRDKRCPHWALTKTCGTDAVPGLWHDRECPVPPEKGLGLRHVLHRRSLGPYRLHNRGPPGFWQSHWWSHSKSSKWKENDWDSELSNSWMRQVLPHSSRRAVLTNQYKLQGRFWKNPPLSGSTNSIQTGIVCSSYSVDGTVSSKMGDNYSLDQLGLRLVHAKHHVEALQSHMGWTVYNNQFIFSFPDCRPLCDLRNMA